MITDDHEVRLVELYSCEEDREKLFEGANRLAEEAAEKGRKMLQVADSVGLSDPAEPSDEELSDVWAVLQEVVAFFRAERTAMLAIKEADRITDEHTGDRHAGIATPRARMDVASPGPRKELFEALETFWKHRLAPTYYEALGRETTHENDDQSPPRGQ